MKNKQDYQEKLLKALQLDKGENPLKDKIELDKDVGFSFKSDIPEEIKTKLNSKKKSDYFSMIYVKLGQLIHKDKTEFPLIFRFVLCEKIQDIMFEVNSHMINPETDIYNFIDKNQYKIDIETGHIYKGKKRRRTEFKEVFDSLLLLHFNENGKSYRKKKNFNWIKRIFYPLAFLFRLIFSSIYLIITGKKIIFMRSVFGKTKIQAQIKRKIDVIKLDISFFNVQVNIIPITTYSSLHLAGYIVFFLIDYRPIIYTTILNNNFLVVLYVIVSLVVFQILIGGFFKLLSIFFSFLTEKLRVDKF